MSSVTVEQAKAEFESLLAKVQAGEEVTIFSGNHPVAVLTPSKAHHEKVQFNPPIPGRHPLAGMVPGGVWMAEDFDAPLEDFREYMCAV